MKLKQETKKRCKKIYKYIREESCLHYSPKRCALLMRQKVIGELFPCEDPGRLPVGPRLFGSVKANLVAELVSRRGDEWGDLGAA